LDPVPIRPGLVVDPDPAWPNGLYEGEPVQAVGDSTPSPSKEKE
jgi:hypothetical protein